VNRFPSDELVVFLRRVDLELKNPCRVVLVGGAVISLGYRGEHATYDLDYVKADLEFAAVCERVRASMASPVVVQSVGGVLVAPYDYEDRLQPLTRFSFERLTLLIPEAHDFAIMKLGRGTEHDLQGIQEVHGVQPLSLPTLIERYRDSLTQVIGSGREFKYSFLALVERLFSEEEALQLDVDLEPH
jgi:hypothetical protein